MVAISNAPAYRQAYARAFVFSSPMQSLKHRKNLFEVLPSNPIPLSATVISHISLATRGTVVKQREFTFTKGLALLFRIQARCSTN